MYYEEKVVDGVLHWRGTPDGTFRPFDSAALTAMYLKAKNDYNDMAAAYHDVQKACA